MLQSSRFKRIYIACGYTDLRYGIDGLAATVRERFNLNPFETDILFLFCGRRNDRIKALVWDVFCKCKFLKFADKNGEFCISVLEKVAGCPAGLPDAS